MNDLEEQLRVQQLLITQLSQDKVTMAAKEKDAQEECTPCYSVLGTPCYSVLGTPCYSFLGTPCSSHSVLTHPRHSVLFRSKYSVLTPSVLTPSEVLRTLPYY